VLRDGGAAPGSRSALLVLTDGVPNVVPPRGHRHMLARYFDANGRVAPVSTFGFGYALDSKLLAALAGVGGGSYGFIPDASFVGTAFVHALANTLSTCMSQAELKIELDGGATIRSAARASGFEPTSWGGVVPVGPVQYGQSRDVLVRARLPAGSTLRATLTDDSGVVAASSPEVDATSARVAAFTAEALRVDEEVHRHQLLDAIGFALATCEGETRRAKADWALAESLAAAEARRAALSNSIRATARAYEEGLLAPPVSSPYLTALAADVDGQVREALSRADWWQRWGRHWLRSLGSAHLRQACNNFKDASVQSYGGGALFQKERDLADDTFVRLPPPTPSRPPLVVWRNGVQITQTRTHIQSMARYHDRHAPCFHADSAVELADGSQVPIRDLALGDRVATAGGGAATVRCVVRTACPTGSLDLVTLPGGLRVTPWHPVRKPGEAAWRFPANDPGGVTRSTVCEAVFSVLLDGGHAILVDGYEGIGLGHGITDDPIAAHPFFGREDEVRASLRAMEGWRTGVVELDPSHPVERDETTGLVSGLREYIEPPVISNAEACV